MRSSRWLLAALLSLSMGCGGTSKRAGLTTKRVAGASRLVTGLGRARSFGTYVGIVGEPTSESIVLRRLLREPDARQHLDKVWRTGTTESRLYALAGYWYLAPRAYRARVEELRRAEGGAVVVANHGCTSRRVLAEELLRCDSSPPELTPGQGVYAHCELDDARCQDFLGGELPLQLVEGTGFSPSLCQNPPEQRPAMERTARGALRWTPRIPTERGSASLAMDPLPAPEGA